MNSEPTCTNTTGIFYCEQEGKIYQPGNYTINCNFIPNDNSYNSITGWTITTSLTVTTSTLTIPTITWNDPQPIPYGILLSDIQLDATCPTCGNFQYTPTIGTELPVGIHTLYTEFTPYDLTTYAIAYAQVHIEVTNQPIIIWNTPYKIAVTQPLTSVQLDATVSPNIDGTYTYTPQAGTYLTLGEHTLYVTFVPSNSYYATVTGSTTILVVSELITPVVTWRHLHQYMFIMNYKFLIFHHIVQLIQQHMQMYPVL